MCNQASHGPFQIRCCCSIFCRRIFYLSLHVSDACRPVVLRELSSTTGNVKAAHHDPVQPGSQKQSKPGVKSFKLKAPAIESPDVVASSHAQQPPTASSSRALAAEALLSRQQPGGGNKVRAPAAKRGALLPSPSQQQTSNRSSASGVSKAAAQHTSAAPPARHRQSKAGVQSSHAHTRSKAHSVARPAA